MKHTILLLLMLSLLSCGNDVEKKHDRKRLLHAVTDLSSLNYSVKIKKYLIKHNTNTISFAALDSIKVISDKECDTIMSTGVNIIYDKNK